MPMGLLGDMFKGLRMKDPVRGSAQVVSCTGHRGDGIWQNCRMQLRPQPEAPDPRGLIGMGRLGKILDKVMPGARLQDPVRGQVRSWAP